MSMRTSGQGGKDIQGRGARGKIGKRKKENVIQKRIDEIFMTNKDKLAILREKAKSSLEDLVQYCLSIDASVEDLEQVCEDNKFSVEATVKFVNAYKHALSNRDLTEAVGEVRAKEIWEELKQLPENVNVWTAKATPEELEKIKKTKWLGARIVGKVGDCCLCGKEYTNYGNNARPIAEGRCCDDCDVDVVLLRRLDLQREGKKWNNPLDRKSMDGIKEAYMRGERIDSPEKIAKLRGFIERYNAKHGTNFSMKNATGEEKTNINYAQELKEKGSTTIPKGSPWSEVENIIGSTEQPKRRGGRPGDIKEYVRKCKDYFKKEQKKIPGLWRALMTRRYIIPPKRQEDYYNQEACDFLMLDFITEYTQKLTGRGNDEVLNTQWLALIRAMEYERPTLYLEKELAPDLNKAKLPMDLSIDMILWQFPSIRVYLPKGFMTIKRQGVDCSLMYLDIVRVEKDVKYQLHKDFIEEIVDVYGDYKAVPLVNTYTGMGVSGNLDFDCPEGPLAYAGTTPINQTTIAKMLSRVGFHELESTLKSDDLDNEFTNNMLCFALRILMFMSSYQIIPDKNKPLETDIIRKPKMEGERLIAGLYHAKFVGQQITKIRESVAKEKGLTIPKDPTGIHTSPHFVSGHPKMQAYGPKSSLRKLIWVMPYHTIWHGKEGNEES